MNPEERSPYRPDYREENNTSEPGAGFFGSAREWAAGRSPWARLILWIYLAWVFFHHLGDPLYKSWFGGLNLGIHELGHVLTVPLGMFIHMSAGTLAQCLAPLISAVIFYRQRDYFAVGFASGWLGINLFEVATYAGDAVVRELPLVSPFAGVPIHDWNYLLGKLGLLDQATAVATLFRLGGSVFFLTGLAITIWLITVMLRTRAARPTV